MKTMQIDQFGGPDVLHLAEASDPHPGRGQVRVRLRAIGVNPFDPKVRYFGRGCPPSSAVRSPEWSMRSAKA